MPDPIEDPTYTPPAGGWSSTSLSNVLSGPKAMADGLLVDLGQQINDLQVAINKVNSNLSLSQQGFNQAAEAINELQEAGIYYIKIEPGTGEWINRLTSAANAPRRLVSDHSAVFLNLTISATAGQVTNAFNNMESALKEPVKIKAPKLTNIAFDPPEQPFFVPPKPELPTNNVWEEMSLGKMFPGIFETVSGGVVDIVESLNELKDGLKALNTKMDSLTALRQATQDFVNALAASGIYRFSVGVSTPETLTWEGKINAYKQAYNACNLDPDCILNNNWPPFNNPALYSAGFCLVVIGPDPLIVQGKLTKALSLISKTFNR